MALFVTLPFVGFWLGVGYGKSYIERSVKNYVPETTNSEPQDRLASDTQVQRVPHELEEYVGVLSTELFVGGERYEVALVADNLVTERTTDSFCGHDKGVLRITGTFHLVSSKDGMQIDSMPIEHVRSFAEGRLHDGIRLIEEQGSGNRMLGIYQYESCNTESLALYYLTEKGDLISVPFVQDETGDVVYTVGTSRTGIESIAEGFRTCTHNNTSFQTTCSLYSFTGSTMQLIARNTLSEPDVDDVGLR